METRSPGEDLSDDQYVTLILRLLVDPEGRLVHGEVLDAAGRPCRRFRVWSGLARAVRGALGTSARSECRISPGSAPPQSGLTPEC